MWFQFARKYLKYFIICNTKYDTYDFFTYLLGNSQLTTRLIMKYAFSYSQAIKMWKKKKNIYKIIIDEVTEMSLLKVDYLEDK